MSGSTTPNYGFALPAIGGNQDSWGNLLNANWTAADSAIHGLASGYLPLTGGGTINGNLGVTGNLGVSGNASVTGGLGAASVYASGAITAGGALQSGGAMACGGGLSIATGQVSDFDLYRAAPNRVLQWEAGWNIAWTEAGGSTTWNSPTLQLMRLDGSGNLNVAGTVHGTNVLLAGGLSVGDVLRDLLARVADLEALRLA